MSSGLHNPPLGESDTRSKLIDPAIHARGPAVPLYSKPAKACFCDKIIQRQPSGSSHLVGGPATLCILPDPHIIPRRRCPIEKTGLPGS